MNKTNPTGISWNFDWRGVIIGLLALVLLPALTSAEAAPLRHVVSLDGVWQIAEGNLTTIPAAFERRVPVPGLADMARPPFVEPGPKVADREQDKQKDPRRDAFWYRRTFTIDGAIPPVATLKVGKAMFGTRVILNGKLLGDHAPCFTPGLFDARGALKIGENDLIIRIGADRSAIPDHVPSGYDLEKTRYIPGIFDSVELILCGTPAIVNAQVTPDLSNHLAQVRVWLKNAAAGKMTVEVREVKSGKLVGKGSAPMTATEQTLDLAVPIAGCRLWSPEDPFLYELTVRTSGDEFKTRFGMRTFKLDPATGRAVLNGKPYFLRGSNVTLYRFFEDPERGDLPWREKWVRLLHQRVKDMRWNCLRYCIGFPPEFWYRIADEEGILIQDEFPIWNIHRTPYDVDELAGEFREWMQERWNHPCVMIWDASNETIMPEIADAFAKVRGLDLSHRPWDNGWFPSQVPGDCFESHPYHFDDLNFKLSDLAKADPAWTRNAASNAAKNPVVINEYGWLWLNRDGTPTTLTKEFYQKLLGKDSTTAQRFHLQATYLAADTEFWRSHRKAAAVMHFTTLGYSRPDGQTSDHWLDIKNLKWEPEFYRYVRDSFAPVGLMLDFWSNRPAAGTKVRVPVVLMNDLYQPWAGPVTLRLIRGDRVLAETKQAARIEALGTTTLVFDLAWPDQAGPCVLEAALRGADGEPVRSVRDLEVADTKPLGLAFGKTVTASSVYAPERKPENAVDGDPGTYWSSAFKDDAWLAVDLGGRHKISRVVIHWEAAFAKAFAVQVSTDGQTWADVYQTTEGKGGVSEIKFSPVEARHVRLTCTQRGTQWGNAVYEMQVFE